MKNLEELIHDVDSVRDRFPVNFKHKKMALLNLILDKPDFRSAYKHLEAKPYGEVISGIRRWRAALQEKYEDITTVEALRHLRLPFLFYSDFMMKRDAIPIAVRTIENDEFTKLHESLLKGSKLYTTRISQKKVLSRARKVRIEYCELLNEYMPLLGDLSNLITKKLTDEEIFRYNPSEATLSLMRLSHEKFAGEHILRDKILEVIGIKYGTRDFVHATVANKNRLRLSKLQKIIFEEAPAIFQKAVRGNPFYADMNIDYRMALRHLKPYMFAKWNMHKRKRMQLAINKEKKAYILKLLENSSARPYWVEKCKLQVIEHKIQDWVQVFKESFPEQQPLSFIAVDYLITPDSKMLEKALHFCQFLKDTNSLESIDILQKIKPSIAYFRMERIEKAFANKGIPEEYYKKRFSISWLDVSPHQFVPVAREVSRQFHFDNWVERLVAKPNSKLYNYLKRIPAYVYESKIIDNWIGDLKAMCPEITDREAMMFLANSGKIAPNQQAILENSAYVYTFLKERQATEELGDLLESNNIYRIYLQVKNLEAQFYNLSIPKDYLKSKFDADWLNIRPSNISGLVRKLSKVYNFDRTVEKIGVDPKTPLYRKLQKLPNDQLEHRIKDWIETIMIRSGIRDTSKILAVFNPAWLVGKKTDYKITSATKKLCMNEAREKLSAQVSNCQKGRLNYSHNIDYDTILEYERLSGKLMAPKEKQLFAFIGHYHLIDQRGVPAEALKQMYKSFFQQQRFWGNRKIFEVMQRLLEAELVVKATVNGKDFYKVHDEFLRKEF